MSDPCRETHWFLFGKYGGTHEQLQSILKCHEWKKKKKIDNFEMFWSLNR